MRRRLFTSIFLAGLALSGRIVGQTVTPSRPAGPDQAASSGAAVTGTAAISGVVVDAVTGRPVPGATVSLSRWQSGVPLPRVVADGRGRFVFRNLAAADNYFLDASRFGYAPTRYGWSGPNGPLTLRGLKLVPLTDGQWVSTIEIPLWRLGSITGRVTDERNEPVVGVAVRAFLIGNIAGNPQLVAGPIAITDDRGVYRLAGLEPGRYTVAALSVQSTVASTTAEAPQRRAVGELESGGVGASSGAFVSAPGIDVDGRHRLVVTNFVTPPPPSAGQARAYPATFYPGVRTATQATGIDIGYGDLRTGVDVQLRPVPAVRVAGRVQGYSGTPPQMLLRLMAAGNERLGFGSEAATTTVEPDGTFTFLNVPDGNYTILAQAGVMDFFKGSSSNRFADAPGFPGGGVGVGSFTGVPGFSFLTRNGQPSELWGRSSVAVGNRDITDAVVELHPTVTVRGRFVFAEGTRPPEPTRELFPQAQPANGDPTLGSLRGTSERDGSFRFSIPGLLGGTYLMTSNFSIVSVMWQGRDLTEIGFDASSGRDFDDVVVTLTDKQVELTGLVNDTRPSGLSAVIAFPVERERWVNFGWEARRFRTTRAGSDGTYQLTGLPAGDYYVIAVDTSKVDAWVDPKFLVAAAPLATRISLDWGAKATQNLSFKEVSVK